MLTITTGIMFLLVTLKWTDVTDVHTASIIKAMMEAIRISETSVNFNVTTRRCILVDSWTSAVCLPAVLPLVSWLLCRRTKRQITVSICQSVPVITVSTVSYYLLSHTQAWLITVFTSGRVLYVSVCNKLMNIWWHIGFWLSYSLILPLAWRSILRMTSPLRYYLLAHILEFLYSVCCGILVVTATSKFTLEWGKRISLLIRSTEPHLRHRLQWLS
jgi:hypothetical protein